MPYINKYIGVSASVLGATYLSMSPRLVVNEGFLNDEGNVSVIVGDFDVDDINYSAGVQKVKISAQSIDERLNKQSNYISRNLRSGVNYYTEFGFYDVLERDFVFDPDITSVLASGNPASFTFNGTSELSSTLYRSEPLRNARLLTKITAVSGALSIGHNLRYTDDQNTYRIRYADNSIYLEDVTTNVITNYATVTGVTVYSNEPIYLYTAIYNNRIIHAGSTDGIRFIKRIDTNISPNSPKGFGLFGVLAAGSGTQEIDVNTFQLSEFQSPLTIQDLSNHVFYNAKIQNINYINEISGISDFIRSTGSCWFTGNSGYATFYSGASTFNTLLSTGSTFTNFVLETDIIGVSGVNVGLAMGTSGIFYTYTRRLDLGLSEGLHYFNGSRNTTDFQGIHLKSLPNTTYNWRMIRNDNQISWYINKQLVASTVGLSFLTDTIKLGFVVYGGYGSTATFSNVRVSILDDIIDSVNIDENSRFSSIIDRYLPNNISIVSRGYSPSFVKNSGVSVNISLGDTSIISYDSRIDKTQNLNVNVARGDAKADFVGSSYYLSKSLVGSQQEILNRSNLISDKQTLELISSNAIRLEQLRSQFELRIKANPLLEQYDSIGISSTYMGVTTRNVVESFNRSLSYNGNYEESITLTSKIDG